MTSILRQSTLIIPNAHTSRDQLFIPSDFDFKLSTTGKPLSQTALIKLLKQVDIAFPVMHGTFGEDEKLDFGK